MSLETFSQCGRIACNAEHCDSYGNSKVTQLVQQRRFRRISASAVRAGKKVQLSQIVSRLSAVQRDIDEVRTLPLTPKGWLKKRICHLNTDCLIFP